MTGKRRKSGLIVPGDEGPGQEAPPPAEDLREEPGPEQDDTMLRARGFDQFLALGYQPMGDVIMVIPRVEHEIRPSGIHIPTAVLEKQRVTEGDVLAVGPGRYAEFSGNIVPMNVKRGDRVVFSHFAGSEIEEEIERNGETKKIKIRVMRQHDILFKRVAKDPEPEDA